MKLNKYGREYIDPDQFKKPCRITDKQGLVYHPTQAPAGFCKCGVVLKLNTSKEDYIFPSRSRAIHAKEHTIRWLKENGFEPVDYDNFTISYVE